MTASFATLKQYWHTLRYLRPIQFYGRLWFLLYRPKVNLAGAPAARVIAGQWQAPAARLASLTAPTVFRCLNEQGDLDEIGWDNPSRDKLWRYNQHYFDDLNAANAVARVEWHKPLMDRWAAENLPGKGSGWEPYPLSLRLVNWVKWARSGRSLSVACEHSMAVQARWLMQRLEIHLLGNHLFSNAKALVFAGLYFSGKEADQWLVKGLTILRRQLPEQILPDGGHFERSTMYHALAVEDMLDLVNVARCYSGVVPAAQLNAWEAVVPDMLRWLTALCHPDGEIGFFNDAAFDIAPSTVELFDYAQRLGFCRPSTKDGITDLTTSGYLRLQNDKACILFDAASVGPNYLPGHAHADTLSLELSVHGQRLLVNSGTSCYGVSDERLRQRGTAAHNCLVVNNENSSQVWSGFRVARRAEPFGRVIREDDEGVLRVACSHDGYRRLTGKPTHHRELILTPHALEVKDSISGHYKTADLFFHFHPAVTVSTTNQGLVIQMPCGTPVEVEVTGGTHRLQQGTWHPSFGRVEPNYHLRVVMHGNHSLVRFTFSA